MYFPNLIKQAIMEPGEVDLLGALCISVKNNNIIMLDVIRPIFVGIKFPWGQYRF